MWELVRKCWSAGKQAKTPSSPARASRAGCMQVSRWCLPAAFRVPQQRCMKNKIPGFAQAHTYPTAVARLHKKRLEPNSAPGQSPCSGLSGLCWHDTGASPEYHSISFSKEHLFRDCCCTKKGGNSFSLGQPLPIPTPAAPPGLSLSQPSPYLKTDL